MTRPLVDTLLIFYVMVFALLKAFIFQRDSRLGWSLAAFNVALAAIFGYALVAGAWLPLAEARWPGTLLRLTLAVVITWAGYELLRTQAYARWREDEDAHGEAMHAHGREQGHLEGMAQEQADEHDRRVADPVTVGDVHLDRRAGTVGEVPTPNCGTPRSRGLED